MPTADASFLDLSTASSTLDERGSARTLDAVGVASVLGAMSELRAQRGRQPERRASEPSPDEIEMQLEYEDTLRARRVPADSDAFLKAR